MSKPEHKMNVVIVDDEAPARKRLRKLLGESSFADRLDIVAEAKDGVEAVKVLSENHADVVFLDIQMPGFDGFEVLDRLSPGNRPVVIFTTAFDEYALRAFEANAVDYLLKPIPSDRLDEALARAAKLAQAPGEHDNLARMLDWIDAQAIEKGDQKDSAAKTPAPASYLEQLSIPYRDRILIIPIERIISIEINEGITRVNILEDDPAGLRPRIRQHIVNYTLDQLGSQLHPDYFMRIHRSAIVQFKQIKELIPWFSGRYKLIMAGNHEVIASRERSKVLKDRLMI